MPTNQATKIKTIVYEVDQDHDVRDEEGAIEDMDQIDRNSYEKDEDVEVTKAHPNTKDDLDENVPQKNAEPKEKTNEVHEDHEKDKDEVAQAKTEVDGDHDTQTSKMVEIDENDETNNDVEKEDQLRVVLINQTQGQKTEE